MGARYIVPVTCPKCGFFEPDAFYAPTSGFLWWRCPKCMTEVDLEEYTGINAESTANTPAGAEGVRLDRAAHEEQPQ